MAQSYVKSANEIASVASMIKILLIMNSVIYAYTFANVYIL